MIIPIPFFIPRDPPYVPKYSSTHKFEECNKKCEPERNIHYGKKGKILVGQMPIGENPHKFLFEQTCGCRSFPCGCYGELIDKKPKKRNNFYYFKRGLRRLTI